MKQDVDIEMWLEGFKKSIIENFMQYTTQEIKNINSETDLRSELFAIGQRLRDHLPTAAVMQKIWSFLNTLHHFTAASDKKQLFHFLPELMSILLSESNFQSMDSYDEMFVCAGYVDDGDGAVAVLLWDTSMSRERRIELLNTFHSGKVQQKTMCSGVEVFEIKSEAVIILIDEKPILKIERRIEHIIGKSFLRTLKGLYRSPTQKIECQHFEDPNFFIKEIDGSERNLLWERYLYDAGIRNSRLLDVSSLPFEIVCGYFLNREALAEGGLPVHRELAKFMSQHAFNFKYFEGSEVSIFLLSDCGYNFSRLQCLKSEELIIAQYRNILRSYRGRNLQIAIECMGSAGDCLFEEIEISREVSITKLIEFLLDDSLEGENFQLVNSRVASQIGEICAEMLYYRLPLKCIPRALYRELSEKLVHFLEDRERSVKPVESSNLNYLTGPYVNKVLDELKIGDAHADAEKLQGHDSSRGPATLFTLSGQSGLANNGKMLWTAISEIENTECREISFPYIERISRSKNNNRTVSAHRKLNIFAMNADLVVEVCAKARGITLGNSYNIGFFLWETSKIPEVFRPGVNLMNEIWVPSRYVKEIFHAEVGSHIPVINIGKHIDIPKHGTYPIRDRFGIPDEAKIFLSIGDFGSSLPRKNILASVEAFAQSGFADDEAAFVIKIRKIDRRHWSNYGYEWEKIERIIASNKNIHVLVGGLSEYDYWSLLASVDCLVSLHRSEGFGYGLAHAHGIGLPTIASDYSGNTDFCTRDTSYLVPCTEIRVDPRDMNHIEDIGGWADPNVRVAANHMREIVDGSKSTETLVRNARKIFEEKFSGSAFREKIRERIAIARSLTP